MKLLVCTQALDKNHPILGFFHGWVLEFAKHFGEVHVICLQKGDYTLPSHVHVYSLGKEEGESKLKYIYRFYTNFGHIFFKVRVDFVFFHMGAIYNINAFPFFMLRKFYHTRFYWWKTHGHINAMGKLALCFVDKVFTASSKSFPVVTAKKVVVGHAVMVPLLWQQHAPTGVPIILFVGRITPVKKVEVVIEVARILRERKIPCMVRIVGDTPDATYNAKILHLIQQHSLKDTVTMVGPKIESALGEEYLHATVSINPSETGSIDKVVLNAMSYGIPVVALERTYGEILNPYHLAVSTQDPVDYADRIEEIISLGTERSVLSLKLREEVTSRHALDTLTQRIFDI